MTIPSLSQDELISLLEKNKFKVISNDYLEEYNRVIVEKDGNSFPVQMNKTCFFPQVVKICTMLGITSPPEHQKCYDQWMNQINKKKIKKEKSQQEQEEE